MPLLGLLLSGIVVSGLVEELPGLLRFSIVILLLSYLPGDVIVTRVFRVETEDVALRLAVAFVVGLATYAILTWVCWVVGLAFGAFLAVLKIATLVLWAAAFAARPVRAGGVERRRRASALLGLGLAALAGVFYVAVPAPLTHSSDAFDHIGYVRAIEREGSLSPRGVLATARGAAAVKADPRKGALHPLLAAASEMSAVAPAQVWRWLPVWAAPAALLAFLSFALRLLPSGGYAAFAVALFVMFQGGLGRLFLGNIGYGQHLVLVFHWVLLCLALALARRPGGRLLGLILLIAAGAAFIHIDALIHFGLLVVSLWVFHRVFRMSAGTALVLAAGAALVAVVVLVWKLGVSYQAGNVIHTHPQGLLYFGEIGGRWFIPSPIELLKRYGLLFLAGIVATPTLLLIRRHRHEAMMCLALAAPPIALALNPLVAPLIYDRGTYLVQRFLLNVPVFVITSLVLGSLVAWARRRGIMPRLVGVVVLLVWARLFMLSAGVWAADVRAALARTGPVLRPEMQELVDFVREKMPAGSVVVSDPVTSYTLSAFTDVRVVSVLHQHGNPNDPLVADRLRAVGAVMSPYALQEEAINALRHYGVDYIVLNGSEASLSRDYLGAWDPGVVPELRRKFDVPNYFRLVYEADGILVIRVDSLDFEQWTWYPTIPFEREAPPNLQRCPVQAGRAIEVVGVAVEPAVAVPGDEIEVTVAYRRNDTVDTVLPLLLRLRFEDRAYFATAARYPGDKYVRRFRERRDGAFRRFRVDRRPFMGVYDSSRWPLGRVVCETFTVRLPSRLIETEYDIECQLVREPLVPNFALKDLVYNDDSFSAPACGAVEIRRFVTR